MATKKPTSNQSKPKQAKSPRMARSKEAELLRRALALALIARNQRTNSSIARETGYGEATIRRMREELPDVLKSPELTSDGDAMRARARETRLAVFDQFLITLTGGMRALNRAIRQFENDAWIKEQDAPGIASGIREIRESVMAIAPIVAGWADSGQPQQLTDGTDSTGVGA